MLAAPVKNAVFTEKITCEALLVVLKTKFFLSVGNTFSSKRSRRKGVLPSTFFLMWGNQNFVFLPVVGSPEFGYQLRLVITLLRTTRFTQVRIRLKALNEG